jgi:hypothetical protein
MNKRKLGREPSPLLIYCTLLGLGIIDRGQDLRVRMKPRMEKLNASRSAHDIVLNVVPTCGGYRETGETGSS